MKVSYRSRRPKHVVTDLPAVYEQVGEPTFCCEGMARQWGRLVGFGVAGKATTSREVCLNVPRPDSECREVNVTNRYRLLRLYGCAAFIAGFSNTLGSTAGFNSSVV